MRLLSVNFPLLAVGGLTVFPLASCTTTSGLSSSSDADGSQTASVELGETPDSPRADKPVEVIAGAPREITEMMAQDRPALHRQTNRPRRCGSGNRI